MKLSDYVIDFIVKQGVAHLFEMAGGAITHLLDSTYSRDDISCVSVHHEQAGAFAAEGYARMNGKLGVAMATSGPGALNLLTGIGSCYFDSVPCLFITGQVNTYEYKGDRLLRQVGFQETDIVSVAKPLTKYAVMVTEPGSIRYHLEKAVYLAQSGRPGPVLLDIPMNVQRADIYPEQLEGYFEGDEYSSEHLEAAWDEGLLKEITARLAASERPLILAGGGVRTSGAQQELLTVLNQTGIPVVTSLMGLDAVAHHHPSFFGLIGSYGNRYANLALANCDLLLILGSRLDTRQTGTQLDSFSRASYKIHIDIDPSELNAKIQADLVLRGDVKAFLNELNNHLQDYARQDLSGWLTVMADYRSRYPDVPKADGSGKIDPNRFIALLSRHSGPNHTIVLDVGQHQMWASQSFRVHNGQRLLNSGGMGAMGFALPAAVGASMAAPDREIVVVAGDGGFQVNIQELETVKFHHLPIKIFIFDNNNLGMVRQFQDMYFDGRRQSTSKGYSCPDLVKVTQAYGIQTFVVINEDHAEERIQEALACKGPCLVHIRLSENTVVNPKLVVNRPIEDMSPYLDREELRRMMVIDMWEEPEEKKKGAST